MGEGWRMGVIAELLACEEAWVRSALMSRCPQAASEAPPPPCFVKTALLFAPLYQMPGPGHGAKLQQRFLHSRTLVYLA